MLDMRGMGTVYRRRESGHWWIQYYLKGKPYRESSGSEKKSDAQKLLRRKLAEIELHTFSEPALDRITIAELVADLLTWYVGEKRKPTFEKDARSRWTLHLAPFFAQAKASDLGTAQLRAYRVERTAAGAADATVNRELQVLRKAYRLAAEAEPPKVRRVPKFALP